jgi:hypothetical protein
MKNLKNTLSSVFALVLLLGIALACNFKSDKEWKSELGGKQLSKATTSGAVSDRVDIWFCSNGEYAKRTQFSGMSTGGAGTLSMADEDIEQGQWRIENSTLILRSQDVDVTKYSIFQNMDADVIELNGNGYLVKKHRECR